MLKFRLLSFPNLKISLIFSLFTTLAVAQNSTTSYQLEALLESENTTISVNQTLTFLLPETDEKNIVYLYDWSNSFKDTNTPLSKRFADDFDRSFYLSNKNKRGYTKINSISFKGVPLVWQRLENQSDIIKVYLFGNTAEDNSIALKLNYQIKIPDQKFTGFGLNSDGEIKLRNWFIALAPHIHKKWILNSNLNLEDNSHLPANFDISWQYPKEFHLESNLTEVNKEEKNNSNKKHYIGNHQTRAQFIFSRSNPFKTFEIGPHRTVLTDMIDKDKEPEIYKTSILKVTEFISDELTPYPHDKELILQLDFDKNPFYGFNQLPSFLKVFSDEFFFEIKFLKTYLNNYLNEKFSIDKRKDHWIIAGLQTYLMIKYVETYYPNQKFIGNLSEIKLLKNYNFSDLPFNTGYMFFYETVMRANFQQTANLSKEKMTKINYKIGIPYKIGVGLRYIEDYVGENVLKNVLKTYIESPAEKSLKELLTAVTSQPIDWFFEDYVQKRVPFDFNVKNITKIGDKFEIQVNEKNNRKAPLKLALLNNDSILSKKWIYLNKKTNTVQLEAKDANYLAINPSIELPEWNKNNNWARLNDRFNFKPLKIQFLKDIENPKTNQLFITPVVGFNYYDGIMMGLNFKNKKLKSQPFQFDFHPQYGLREKTLVGFFRSSYRKYHENKKKYLTQYSMYGSSFHYNTNLRYTVFVPSITFFYRSLDLRSNYRQYLNFSMYSVQRENEPSIKTSPNYEVLNMTYNVSNKGAINYFSANTSFEMSDQFSKIQSSIDFRKLYPSGRQFAVRMFLGKFLWNNTGTTDYFDFNLNRPNDYLFQYSYLGRSETTGFYSQQFVTAEGGFKSKFEESNSNNYMATINVFMGLWKWVEVYGDLGFLKNKGTKAVGYFDSGIRLNLLPDYLELYFPVVSSNGWEISQPNYSSKIRFVLSLRSNSLKNLFTRNWF